MKRSVLGTLLFLVSCAVFAQNEGISAPYVSRLRTDVEGSYIKLLWKDVSVAGAKYVVYRYTHELSAQNLKDADKLAVVPAGQGSYVDQPPEKRPYFYAVLVQDPSGKVSDLFIPFRNVTTEGVEVKALVGEQPELADVTSLKASISGSSVNLTFKSSASSRELIVYRSTAPISSESDLLSAVSVGVIPSSQDSFEDTPVRGIPYFYAIIDSAMLANGKVVLIPGQNVTKEAIELPLQRNAMGQIELAPKRPRPLPFLTLNSNIQTGAPLAGSSPTVVPDRTPLSKSTATAVDALLGSLTTPKPTAMHPTILDPEKGVVASGGEEYTLKRIVDGPFSASDWPRALEALNGFLNIPHSKPIESRARFYLGEAYYFAKDYRKSFLQFLVVENTLYTEVQPWLDALFTKLKTGEATQP